MQNTSELWSPQVALEWMSAPSAKLNILGNRPTWGPAKPFWDPKDIIYQLIRSSLQNKIKQTLARSS